MPDQHLLAGLSETLQALFEQAITQDPAPPLTGNQIDLRSPREMRLDNESLGLSLWLYRVDQSAQPRSLLPTRVGEPASAGSALEARYLLTPITEDPLADLALLGRVLATLHAHPVLAGADLRGALANGRFEVRLSVDTLTLSESAQLWQALQEPYRPAVACLARLVEA